MKDTASTTRNTPFHLTKKKIGHLCLSLDQSDIEGILHSSERLNWALRADMIELRLLKSEDFEIAPITQDFLRKIKKPLLVRFDISESRVSLSQVQLWLEVLQKLPYKPSIVDLPLKDNIDEVLAVFREREREIHLQVSYHDPIAEVPAFQSSVDIIELVEKMSKIRGVDSIKCAFNPHSIHMALEVLLFLSQRTVSLPITVIAMGELYSFFRVLAHFWGNFLTFTCLKGFEKALGQIDIETLKSQYLIDSTPKLTSVYGLIGSPVDKSLSHTTHTKLLHSLKHTQSVYVKIDVSKEECDDSLLKLLRKLHFRGLSVTTPLKEKVSSWVPGSKGPVNTILIEEENQVRGWNTDTKALLDALQARGVKDEGNLVIIGSGDVARACAIFFQERGWKVHILARSYEKACERFEGIAHSILNVYDTVKIRSLLQKVTSIVNTTPLDASSDLYQMIPTDWIQDEVIVAEFAYPQKSDWFQDICHKRGHLSHTPHFDNQELMKRKEVSGFELWMRQAAWQFLYWGKEDFSGEESDFLRNVYLYLNDCFVC